MVKHNEYILGNASLHLQLETALAVMTQLICNASRPPTAQQLAEEMDVSLRYLRKLLRTLGGGGLLKPHEKNSDTWVCTRAPHAISLADVYNCLLAQSKESTSPFVAAAHGGPASSSAELLLMQATMAINQLILQQLQQFDLGRLKAAESAMMFAASLREKALARRVMASVHGPYDSLGSDESMLA